MKLRLPHKFQAALMAAIASVSFTTLSTGTLGAAFFVSGHAFAEDAEEDPSATIDIGDTNLDAQAAMEEEEGTAETKEPGSAPINEAGFNGGPGNNAGLLITESVDIDETALDTVVSSEPVAATSGTADATPADDLGFTTNSYATGSDTSNGSDSVFTETATPAAAVAATDFQQQATTESTSSGTSSSTTGTATESVATPSGAAGFGGISTPTLGLSSSSLGSTTPAISTPVASGVSVGGGSSNELTPVTTLGDANAAFANATWTFENSMSADTTISNLSYEWKGGGSATYVDSNMNKGTKVGNYWLDADLGKAITFTDGQYIKVGTNPYWTTGAGNLNTGNNDRNSYTVMAWVKLDATAGEQEFFGTGDGVQNGMGFGLNGGKADILTKWLAHNNFNALTVTAGQWVNVALTYDMDTNTGSAYINGSFVGSQTIGNSNMPGGECSYIGASAANAARDNFAGQIAELSILSGALTQQEILAAAHLTSTSPDPTPAEGTDIGNWMAIGDSITHGTYSSSYRWALQKIFTDNGISFDAEGYKTGCYTSSYDNLSYGGADFDNQHSAQFNIWTDEIAGTNYRRSTSVSGLQSTNIKNWLGLSTILTPTSTGGTGVDGYTGPTFAPDTYTIMLGTNDLNGISETSMATIFANDAVIVGAVNDNARNNNKTATLYMMSVTATNKSSALANNIASYNAQLQSWVNEHKAEYANTKLIYVDINEGLQDVTKTSGWGVASMYNGDTLHPEDQASLIIAGNLARGMGYAGRTAGQFRKAAGDFAQHDYAGGFSALPSTGLTNVTLSGSALNFGAEGASSASFAWDTTPTGGYTVDFSLLLGDGASNNWDTSTNFSVNLGNGTLNVNEAYIQWGSTILYSRDASTTANLRVAYVQGDTANNLAAGYYVWLGDQLIGEACAASGSVANAVTFSYSGSGNALLKSVAMDSTGSWAPTTNLTEGDDGYHANPFVDNFRINTRQGEGDFSQANVGATVTKIVDGKRKSGNYYYANYPNDSGNVGNCHIWSFNNTEGSGSEHYVTFGFGSGSTAVTARLAGANMNFHTVHGLYNGSAVTMSADVLTQLDSVGGTFGAYHGSENMTSTGKVTLTMNEGTISGDVVGGFAVVANDSQTIASTEININYHGVVGGNVYGGSTANGTVTNARVAITGGRIEGSVYGGGTAGTVGTATVEITGGEIKGSVYGGGTAGTVTNPTSVTVKTYVPYIHGNIEADAVTISDLHAGPSDDEDGFDKYSGTITADTITLDNTTAFSADAHLVTQTLNVQNKSSVTIHDLTLTACEINVDGSSVATLDGTLTLGDFASYTGTLNLADGLSIDVSALDFGDMTQDVTLLSTTSGNLGTTNVNNITLDFGESPEPTSYSLVNQNNNLVLTFDAPASDVLIWNGGPGTWNKQAESWHKNGSSTYTAFTDGSDVRFDSASNNCTVTVGEAVQANSMTINSGVAVTIVNGNNLSTTLQGGGTYVLPGGEKAMPSGVKLGSDWTGAVRISGTGFKALSFTNVQPGNAGLATQNSAIELNGVAGWANTGAHDANLILTNNGDASALKLTDGSTGTATTFSGKISGTGDFEHAWNKSTPTINLTGDLSSWTGSIVKTGGNNVNFNLTDNSASIAAGAKMKGSGALNVSINNSNAVTLTGNFTKTSGTLNLNVGNAKATDATFAGAITDANLNVAANSTATISGEATLAGLSGAGAIVVDGTDGVLSLTSSVSSFTGSLTVNQGATLEFAGADMLSTGTLTLASGSILDLTNIGYSSNPVVLATASSGSTIVDNGAELLNVAAGYSGALSVSGNNLLLTFSPLPDLVWDGTSTDNTWTNDSSTPWQGGTFRTGSNVTFDGTAANKVVLVQSAITAGSVTVSGLSEGDSYTFDISSAGSLTASSVTVDDNASLTVESEGGAFALGDVSIGSEAFLATQGAASEASTINSLSGTGTFSKSDSGTVSITGASDFSGDIYLIDGTLNANVDDALGTGSVYLGAFDPGQNPILNLGGAQSIQDLSVGGGGTVNVRNNNALTESAVQVSMGGTLVLEVHGTNDSGAGMPNSITGTGTVKITDTNFQYHSAGYLEAFAGTVVIADGGVVHVGNKGNKFAAASLEVATDGTLRGWGTTFSHDILLNGGTLAEDGSNQTYSGTISLGADSSVNASSGKTVTLSGNVTGGHVLTTSGGGTVKLSGTDVIGGLNATAGTTQIAGSLTTDALTGDGTVNVLSGGNLILTDNVESISGTLNIQQNATLTLGGYDSGAVTATNLTLAGGSILDLTAFTDIDGTEESITLVQGGTISQDYLNAVTLHFSNTSLDSRGQLSVVNDNLVLTFTPVSSELIWDHTQSTNWNTTDNNWHLNGQESGSSVFTAGADVRFDAEGSNGQTVTLGGTISAGDMTIDKDVAVTINANNNLTANLKGEGTYVLPGTQKTLPAGVTLDDTDWTGAVQMSGTGIAELRFVTKDASSTYGLATDNSVIELKGVAGWMRTEAQLRDNDHIGTDHNANIRLVNVDRTPALKITDGGSNSTTTLSGKITGSGTFEHNWGGGSCTFKLTGDLSEWNGEFNKSGGSTTTLALTDNTASTIAPDIKNTGNGTLNVNINNSNTVTLTGDIAKTRGTLNINVGNSNATAATFTGEIDGAALSVGSGSTATLQGESSLASLTGAGDLMVDSGNNIVTLNGISGYTGDITVDSGTLYLVSAVDSIGDLTVNATGSLKLSEMGTSAVTTTGTLTLNSGSTLDLTALDITGAETSAITLFKGGEITPEYLDSVILTFADSSLAGKGQLSVSGSDLVLIFTGNLIWDNNTGNKNWSNSSDDLNWHGAGDEPGEKYFATGNNVTFQGSADEATLADNIIAGAVTLEDGAALQLDINSRNLTTDRLIIGEGAKLTTSGGTTTINTALSGSGDWEMIDSGTLALDGKASNYTGKVTVNGKDSTLVVDASNFGGKLSQKEGGNITLYGDVNGTIADAGDRIEVLKKGDSRLTLKSGSEKSIAKVTTEGSNNNAWMLAEGNSTNAEGLYTDIALNGTGDQNGLILTQANQTVNIGNLSGTAVSAEIRGDWDSQSGGRVLALHQDENTTFAGKFRNCSTRSIGLNKYGAGTLTLTGENGSTSAMNVYEGTVELSGSGKWAGAANVHDGGTLRITSAGTDQTKSVTVNPGGTLDLATDGTVRNDTAVFTVNGGTIANSGTGTATLDIETLNVGSNGALLSGNVNLGTSADPLTILNLENTLVTKGANTIYADSVTYTGSLGESVGTGTTYLDAVSGSTVNGYVESARVVIVENASGSLTSNLAGKTVTSSGWTYTLQADEQGNVYFTPVQSEVNAMRGDYYVNANVDGAVMAYGDTTNSTGLDRTNIVFLNGGDLNFTTMDLKQDVLLHVHKDATVGLGEGRTLYENTVYAKAGSTMTLDGEGTYVLTPATLGTHASLPAGTVLAKGEEGFTGTVKVSKGSVLNGTDLSGLANGQYSTVAFNGVTGSLAIGEIAENIRLEDYNSIPALALTNGTDGETRNFSGTITGDGTLARSYVTGTGDKGGTQNYIFSGDVSNWNGTFDNQINGETTNLTFSGDVDAIGVTIMNGPQNSAGFLNVYTDGEKDKVFNQTVTASSFSAQGGNVDFRNVLDLTGDASASGDTVLTFHEMANIGGNLSGNVKVADGGNVTVAGAATLGDLNLIGTSTTRLNGDVSASGDVTVGNDASLYLNGGGITLGDGASLTVADGAKIGLIGWSDSTADHTSSGVKTTGFTGGQLFSVAEGGTATVNVNPITIVMKDGAEFQYTGEDGSRVKVYTSTDDGAKYGTVEIIDAVYYYVADEESKSMDDVIREAAGGSLDYILIADGGMLSGVTDANKSTYGISGLQGGGTIAVGTGGTLTDGQALETFAGSIQVGPDSTYATDGSVARTLTVNGGTLHATDNMILGEKATFTNSGSGESLVIPTVDVDAGKTLEIVKRMSAGLEKTGDGTLRITDTYTLGAARQPMISGDLVVNEGTVVLNSLHRTVQQGDNKGIVAGNITMAGGTDLVCEGIDPLGHSGTATQSITLEAGTEDNLTTMLFTRNGGDPETIQHLTLTTPIYVEGNTLIGGLNLNSFGLYNEAGLEQGSYIHASGINNVIDNTFNLRKNAYFDVDPNSELTLTGDMLKFTGSAAVTNPMVIKTGEGLLDLAGENSSLYAINTKEGEVDVSGHVTFTGTATNQFLMDQGAVFAVNNGGLFEYRDWNFENNDGTTAPGTITASGNAQNYILQNADLVVSDMKLTNHNSAAQEISARLDNVQLVNQGGNVTINNATGEGTTQYIASLSAKSGVTTLHSATLDAASVNPGAALTFTAGETVELGSTILSGGTVNLAGTINVSDLSGFTPQKGGGYADADINEGEADPAYNGFYQGGTYYLIYEEAAGSTVNGADALTLTYHGDEVAAFGKEDDTNSYWFRVTQPSTLYYINGNDAEHPELTTYQETPEYNRMYAGLDATQDHAALNTTGIVLNYNGAHLTLAQDLRAAVRTMSGASGIVANYNGSVDIQENVTLHQSDLSGREGAVVSLVGEGMFDLDGTTLKEVSGGLTQGGEGNWNGTVRASGTADDMIGSMMGNVDSTLLLDGVKGTLTNADTQYVMKIELENGGEGAVTNKALDNTFSTGANRTFTNTVSGSGDILMTGAASGSTQSIAFTGDVSGWKGTEQDAATFETAGQGTTNLKFSGAATEINVDINEGEGSTINLVAGPTVAPEGQTPAQVFNGDINASSLTVEAGANTTLKNTTDISDVIDATAANAKLHVLGTTTAGEVKVGTGSVSIQNNAGAEMATISTSTAAAGNADITGGVKMQSADGQAILAGTDGAQPVTRVDGADIAILGPAASLKIENLVLADDTMLRGTGSAGNLVISDTVVQEMSSVNTERGADGVVPTTALTMTGTKDVTMTFENDKVANLDFASMCQMAQISGSAGTLVFDFTAMEEYSDWEHKFSDYGFIGVNFNMADKAIDASELTVKALTKDASGQVVERIGYYNNGGNGAVVGSIVYFQVPEPTTGTLSLLALCALAARRRRK